MASSIKDIVKKHLEELKASVIQQMSAQRRNASGKSVASLEVKVDDNGGCLEGASSFLYMEHGRSPGRVPKDFTSIIKDWILAKGISYQNLIPKYGTSEQGLKRLSGAIAFSIMKKGTRLYRNKGYNDIYESALSEELKKMAEEAAGVIEVEVDTLHQEETIYKLT